MCLQVFSISEGIFQREMSFIKSIFASCITKQDLFELEVVVEVNAGQGSCRQHRKRYEQFQVYHHMQHVWYSSQEKLMIILLCIGIKEGRPRATQFTAGLDVE